MMTGIQFFVKLHLDSIVEAVDTHAKTVGNGTTAIASSKADGELAAITSEWVTQVICATSLDDGLFSG
jgi:hypothetical protein